MNRIKIIAASAIFIALTVIKFLLPDVGGQVRQVVSYNTDFTNAVSYITAFFSPEDAIEVFEPSSEPRDLSNEYRPISPQEIRAGSITPVQAVAEDPGEAEEPDEVPETADEMPAAVAAFLETQKQFEGYDIPTNVNKDMPDLPFDYATPVVGYNSSGFGYRQHPLLDEIKFHYGTDFAAMSGDDIAAFADGTVTFAGLSDSFGYYITIDHGNGYQTLYAHCSVLYVSSGDTVTAGQKIALVGSTGNATGPHLHFELTHSGVYLNPEYYVNA